MIIKKSRTVFFSSSVLFDEEVKRPNSPVLNKVMIEEKQSIQTNYIEALQNNHQFLETKSEQLGIINRYFDDVAHSPILYSQISFHYYAPARTILFLLEGDSLILEYIQAQAQQFLEYCHTIRYSKIEELSEKQLNDSAVDLLITNYSPYVSDYRFTKDFILMNLVPDRQYWRRVWDTLQSLVIQPV